MPQRLAIACCFYPGAYLLSCEALSGSRRRLPYAQCSSSQERTAMIEDPKRLRNAFVALLGLAMAIGLMIRLVVGS